MLSGGGFIEVFLDFGFSQFFSKFSGSDSSADFEGLFGELDSSDGDDLSFDIWSIDEDSFVIDDIYDSGKSSFERTIVNSSNSTNFNESGVSLQLSQIVTIGFL